MANICMAEQFRLSQDARGYTAYHLKDSLQWPISNVITEDVDVMRHHLIRGSMGYSFTHSTSLRCLFVVSTIQSILLVPTMPVSYNHSEVGQLSKILSKLILQYFTLL